MADLGSYSHADRDIEQGLIALKKGAQLLKYGRKGKPKFCPFRVSNDESSLIWISSRGERSLKLASVSRIIPGQRTAVFQRYLRPDKDYLSFSLIYNDGKRSLDLICKDKVEAEVWIVSLKSLIASGKGRRSKIDGWTDGGLNFDVNRDLISDSPSDSSFSATQDISSSEGSLSSAIIASPMRNQLSNPLQSEQAYMAFDRTNMQAKGPGSDVFRVSVSSAPSTSSHGSAPDDCDALGDVYIWGDVICDNLVKLGPGKSSSPVCTRTDVLLPRLLESNLVLDVHHIACGVRHAALVTRQGELFTWGEESGGRLGHGVGQDFTRPHLVESLSICHVDFVACGEFHSLAVTVAGEIYSWGDGKHRAGLLGNGSDVSHWIPKRISGPLEGLQVVMVTCGPWHTALVTSNGQLFTFGIGTFGNLGHGDRENVLFPREIESLSGLRTIAVACGVWHTAAVVEVIVKQSSASVSSGKLFTWGDGDRNRLGHGDKEARLVPTCVPALIDYNFHKIACGHSLTVGLTTSGHVFTMGSTVYGQLGNPQSDGKLPCLVEDKLSGELVEEIACGAYHVAVLTAKNQVFSWGKGANGRLGHGDIEDRKTPTLIEALKDRHVKYVACGSNYSAAICLHKWVSGAEQSQCAACKQAFGFTRKRHNCYNCGLVYCNACTPRKALKAALAPNPGKPYRVCDPCFAKLTNVVEAGVNNRRNNNMPRLSGDKLDKAEIHLAKSVLPPSNIDLIKQLDSKAAKQGKKADIFSVGRSSYAPPFLQLKDVLLPTAIIDQQRPVPKQVVTPSIGSRSVSPFSRKPSPPRSATPVPTTSGLSFSTSISDSLKKTNELLNQEIHKLRAQVESLTHQCQDKDIEVQKSTKKAQEAVALAAEESAKCKAAKEVIKSLTAQIKDMAERLPPGFGDTNGINLPYLSNGLETNGIQHLSTNTEGRSSSGSFSGSCLASPISVESASFNGLQGTAELPIGSGGTNEIRHTNQIQGRARSLGQDIQSDVRLPNNNSETQSRKSNSSEATDNRDSPFHDGENGSNFRSAAVVAEKTSQVDREWIEQYEPGVYITLVALHDGTRDLKRVRFSRRRFGEHQAETWWSENRENVYERYNVRCSDKSSSVSGQAAAAARRSEGTVSLSSQI